ncbi:MAG: hypothetical protein J6J87_10850, partial [Oscillospiraceae bacterium]|nr:hypothetical protein [Oscillospiraceae bacterium]
MNDRYSHLMETLNIYDQVRRGEKLGYLQEKNYNIYLSNLSPEQTNFRYIIRDNETGEILLSSSGEDSLTGVEDIYQSLRTTSPDQLYYNYREYDDVLDVTIFYDDDGDAILELPGNVSRPYEDGDTYRYAIEYGVDTRLTVDDEFRTARNSFTKGDIRVLYLAGGLTIALLILTVFLMCCAGRRPKAETFTLNWSDRIPYDLYLFAMVCAAVLAFGCGMEWAARSYWYVSERGDFVLLSSMAVLSFTAFFALGEAMLMSTATRIKAHTLLRNTLTWRLGAWLWRLGGGMWLGCKAFARSLGEMAGALPLTGRVIGFSLGYLLINFFLAMGLFNAYETGMYLLLLFAFNGFVLFSICRWTLQWQNLRQGAQAIVKGNPEVTIDTAGMKFFPDLRSHAEALNDLGSAINTAVDERLKSERMKAELITNVSHDLKTPLTSIINYVDLLKKEDIQEEKAKEYIEVLDRKSQRLKKLTEDLVEASKASTGTLTVNAERLGMGQLVDQALGEYTAKLEAASLTLVPSLPQEELYVTADGRHVWRILDNLLGNCVKYAMPGTRVYLELLKWDGNVIFSLKNVSANQLNVPPEELMERFVRGDESRTTEGSGLGLSIARNLTELQGGSFRLSIDGDLFKATVSFPEAK